MKTATLPVLQLNRGDHAAYVDVRRAIGDHAAATLNEMHSVQGYLQLLERAGLGVWPGNRPDSESDPMVWDPDQIDVDTMASYDLLDGGRRAGVHNMAKSLNVIKGTHIASGRRVAIGAAHNIHRQYLPGRRGPARSFAQNLHDAADDFHCATIVGADWNDKPTGKSLEPIRRDPDWHLSQLIDRVVTHGRGWTPDGFAFCDRDADPGVLRFAGQKAIHVIGTDHQGLSAEFHLTIREHR